MTKPNPFKYFKTSPKFTQTNLRPLLAQKRLYAARQCAWVQWTSAQWTKQSLAPRRGQR